MTMIKCSECGKETSDRALVCIICGAPIPSSQDAVAAPAANPAFGNLGDLNGDGRVDFEDFKAAYDKIKKSLPDIQDSEDSKTD
jgi:hypothetical protein